MALDVAGAFPGVRHTKLFAMLRRMGIPEPVVATIAEKWAAMEVALLTEWGLLAPFPKTRGVKEGAVESPILFIVYLDIVLWALHTAFGMEVPSFMDDEHDA
jgi:hypothetical protein